MKLYRSIGDEEFVTLLQGRDIIGKYHSFNEREHIIKTNNAESLGNVVCFFTERIAWKDRYHKIFIEIEIPNEKLYFGTGIYYAAKSLEKTKIWSGRRGNIRYEFQEAYVEKYNSSNVRAIFVGNRYADWYIKKYVLPWAKKNGIIVLENF